MRKLPWVLVALLALLLINAEGQEQFANFAQSTLATAIDNDDTSVVVQTGDGAKFPTCCSGSQDFYVVLQTGTTQEVVRVTNRSSDTLTVVRAQQGSSAASFGVGSRVEQRPTRGTFERFRDLSAFTATDDRILIANGSIWETKAVPDCNGAANKITYTASSNTVNCETDQGTNPITRISGSSGAAGSDITYQTLSSNCASNSTTTLATCMTTTSVGSGTWRFEYDIIYQSGATTTGVDFAVGHSGTVTKMVVSSRFVTSGGTAANALADQVSSNTANLVEGKSNRTQAAKVGSSLGVDTANADMHYILQGVFVISASGSLTLQHASEVAASSQVMSGTTLILHKIG